MSVYYTRLTSPTVDREMASYGGRGGEDAQAGVDVDGGVSRGSEDHAHAATSQARAADGRLYERRTHLHHH